MRSKTFGGAGGRIPAICSRLEKCGVFADVGCDHGYCAQYMLQNGLCDFAVVSDISLKSLNKAATLLSDYAEAGRVRAVCCDGLRGVGNADLVLIAGMGGEEIVRIFDRSYVPRSFVLQPMKNAPLVRRYLIARGCAIEEDDLFRDGRFYFIIKGRASGGTPAYSEAELAFGRDSLKNPLLKDYLAEEIAKTSLYLGRAGGEAGRRTRAGKLAFLKGVYSGEIV